jgi:hypothetical protein
MDRRRCAQTGAWRNVLCVTWQRHDPMASLERFGNQPPSDIPGSSQHRNIHEIRGMREPCQLRGSGPPLANWRGERRVDVGEHPGPHDAGRRAPCRRSANPERLQQPGAQDMLRVYFVAQRLHTPDEARVHLP